MREQLITPKKEGYKYITSGEKDTDIDIIMLTYNHEQFIGQAIDSILMQETDFSYKIIIGEDSSYILTK